MKNMRIVFLMVLLPALAALPLDEPRVPRNADEVARPGGKLPGNVRIALVKVAENFYDPTNVASANDGSGRIFVVERVGRVKIVHKDGRVQKEPFLDLTNINPLGTDVQTGFVEQGLYSIAFHPRFKENGYFYVHYASLPFNGDGVIVRFQADPKSPNIMTPERTRQTSKVLLRIEQPYYNHNGGQIEFGPDGYLYIGSGDGGWEGDPLEAGQDLSTLLGKILRIDVNTSDDDRIPYKIPPANPFAVASAERLMQLFGISELDFSKIKMRARREIWAYGLRNPWRLAFDRAAGLLYIADVGQNQWEEVDVQPAGQGGQNYGWNTMEGAHCYVLPLCRKSGLTLPAVEYGHDEGCSVIGGYVYRGMKWPALAGQYFYSDYCRGWLKSFRFERGAATSPHTWNVGDLGSVLSFGEDAAGELYVLSANGRVYRIEGHR